MPLLRYIFCSFNFIFCIVGVGLVGSGVWLLLENRTAGTLVPIVREETDIQGSALTIFLTTKLKEDQGNKVQIHTMIPAVGWICVGVGAAMFLVSFIGYCGSLQESICLLGTYATLLGLIFILEIIAVSLFFVNKPQVEEEAKDRLIHLVRTRYFAVETNLTSTARILFRGPSIESLVLEQYSTDEEEKEYFQRMDDVPPAIVQNDFEDIVIFTDLFDTTMRSFQCCGVVSYLDFEPYQLPPEYVVPEACCKPDEVNQTILKDPSCVFQPTFSNSWISTGCFDSVVGTLVSGSIIGGIIVGLLQFAGIISAALGTWLVFTNRKNASLTNEKSP